jgi:hypothetical protein
MILIGRRLLIAGILIIAFFSGAEENAETKDKEAKDSVDAIMKLIWKLPEQTGNTDGYPADQKYNIHEHEPAKSIIALGPKCIPELLKWINSSTSTKAEWRGRSSHYTLKVSDIVVCILGEIGGKEELALLERRQKRLDKIWHDARDYKDSQKEWTDDEKAAYMELFEDSKSGMVITMWAVDYMKSRLGIKDENTEKKW